MDDAQAGFLGAFLGVFVIVGIIVWILQGFIFYKLYTKANVALPWLAFIPIANLWPYMWTIKKSAVNILWLLVPIANVVFSIIWTVRLLKAFNINPLWALLYIGLIIPVLNDLVGIGFLVLFGYMAFSAKVQYNSDFDIQAPVIR